MTARSPYQRAELCFALARSTPFSGEREAAIGRGIAIADAAGLAHSLFDIPGRSRSQASASERMVATPKVGRSRAPDRYDRSDTDELLRSFRAHMRGSAGAMESFYATMERREREAGATDGETVYDARRRNFDRAADEARARDAARGSRP